MVVVNKRSPATNLFVGNVPIIVETAVDVVISKITNLSGVGDPFVVNNWVFVIAAKPFPIINPTGSDIVLLKVEDQGLNVISYSSIVLLYWPVNHNLVVVWAISPLFRGYVPLKIWLVFDEGKYAVTDWFAPSLNNTEQIGIIGAGVGVSVGVGVTVNPGVTVCVGVFVTVGVTVFVGVTVSVGVNVCVTVWVGVTVGVFVGVGVKVFVGVGVKVLVNVGVFVGVGVGVTVFVGVGVTVFVGVGVTVFVGVGVGVGVFVSVGVGVGVGALQSSLLEQIPVGDAIP